MTGAIPVPPLPRKHLLDLRFGFALMRDRRIPLRFKLLAFLIAFGITGTAELLEIPGETILSALVPILGAIGDVTLDGAEMIAGPIVIGCLLLPFLAPRHLVERIHAERSTGVPKSPIIEV